MILTLYYMYATFVQWWRLGALKQKLNGTLGQQNALLLTSAAVIADPRSKKCVENLLFEKDGRVACTIVPRQKLSLGQWVLFPKDPRCFPIHIGASRGSLHGPKQYLLLQAHLDSYTPHQYEHVTLEQYGEPVAWRASDLFEVILKTDLSGLTKLMNCYSYADMSINHDLRLITMEVVDVEGHPSKIRYDRKYSTGQQLNFSRVPVHWKRFVATIRHTYSKLNEGMHPKIMIENGGTKPEDKRVPISEVKPIKKAPEKAPVASKNTLEVHGHSGRHRKRDSSNDTAGTNRSSKAEARAKSKDDERDVKVRDTKPPADEREVKPQSADDVKDARTKPTSIEANGVRARDVKVKADDKTVKAKLDDKAAKAKPVDDKAVKAKPVDDKPVKAKPVDDKVSKAKQDGKVAKGKSVDEKDAKAKGTKDTKSKSVDKSATPKKAAEARKPEPDKNRLSVTKPKHVPEQKKAKTYSEAAQSSGSGPAPKNLQRQNATSSKETSPNRVVKPPNILVYADSVVAKDNVKSVLKSIINKEKYTIYDLPVNTSSSFWDSSTTLVIVCGNVPQNLTPHLLQYLVTGGQLLCLCSDLLYSVLQTFSTAEVREHELVRFSYGDWKRVKMMHHIFCYQASPAKKQFSKDSDQSSHSNGSSPVAPRTPSAVEIQHNGKNYTIQVQVLGAEETWQTPSLLLATVKDSPGKAIFSQVHLEVDPSQYQDDENKYTALKDSDKARLEIMKHILSTQLDIDCKTFSQNVTYSPAYFLGRHDHKLEFLNGCRHIDNNKLTSDGFELEFCGKSVDPGVATATRLPVLILSCPTNFSTVGYFETLQTEHVGRLVIYSDILTSSQNLLGKKLRHGMTIIPKQQTHGKGRSDNEWLSPEGCAMFSVQLHVDLNSPLGKSLPLMQHLVMVAVILAVKSIPGLENLDIGLKWPNDLYAYSSIKIGGLIVNSTVESDLAVVNIGCGVNLSNREPTLCVNEIISRYCAENKAHVEPLAQEKFFGLVFNEIESVMNIVQGGDLTYLFDMYYKYWLHNNARITVSTKDGELRDVLVTGIDNAGFLLVQSSDGITSSVQPDGNSFDMLKGLIAPKIS